MPQQAIEFVAPSLGLTIRADLLMDDNPDVIEQVLAQLPLKSVLGHVVVSGESFWMPTRIVHLGRSNMVERKQGSVYLYAPGQTIVMCYGRITETAKVNTFGFVREADMPALRQLGEHVYQQCVAQPRRSVVEINVRRAA